VALSSGNLASTCLTLLSQDGASGEQEVVAASKDPALYSVSRLLNCPDPLSGSHTRSRPRADMTYLTSSYCPYITSRNQTSALGETVGPARLKRSEFLERFKASFPLNAANLSRGIFRGRADLVSSGGHLVDNAASLCSKWQRTELWLLRRPVQTPLQAVPSETASSVQTGLPPSPLSLLFKSLPPSHVYLLLPPEAVKCRRVLFPLASSSSPSFDRIFELRASAYRLQPGQHCSARPAQDRPTSTVQLRAAIAPAPFHLTTDQTAGSQRQ
jgi:hypothetical protein